MTPCTCDTGYQPNVDHTFCEVIPNHSVPCPANASRPSHGAPCACDAGYKFDAAGTSCVLEKYTLSLVIPPPAEVMPGAGKSAYAHVANSDGSDKSGVQVSLSLSVVPEEDGYNHAVGQHTAPHDGSLLPESGATGSDGKLHFEFKAPVAGGIHTITATCTNPSCTNQATGTIKVPGCSVSELTEIPKLSALAGETPEQAHLTRQLEDKMDGYSLLTPATQAAEQCLARRISAVVGEPATSGYEVTSTIRTLAYQKHLRNVWDKFWELKRKVKSDPSIQQRCQTLITKVEGEMGFQLTQDPTDEDERCNAALGRHHCVRYEPADADPKHTKNIAFDIPLKTVTTFERRLMRPPPSTVQREANTCGLTWGGTFRPKPDPIHFQSR